MFITGLRTDTDPFQTDIFILKGKGEETFMPRFNYKGFQYVEVTSSEPVESDKRKPHRIFHAQRCAAGWSTSHHPIQLSIKYGRQPIIRICQICLVTLLIVRNVKKTAGRVMHILPLKPGFTILMESPFMKNGWPITGMNNNPMAYCLLLFQQVAGAMNGAMVPTGQAPLLLFPGIFILFYGDTKVLADCYDNIKRYVDHITEIKSNGLNYLGTWRLGSGKIKITC